jgi:hypothetical protein
MPAPPFAQLTNAIAHSSSYPGEEGKYYLIGIVYNDSQKRWQDGTLIYTSTIATQIDPNNFLTRSGTHYEVLSWIRAPAKRRGFR